MSIQSEVERISTNVQNTLDVIRQTGVSVPENATSDGLPAAAAALANEKQDKLTGTTGQYVGFDSSGNAAAVDPPSSLPEGGSEGKLLGYGTEPEWVDSPVMYVRFTIGEDGKTVTGCSKTAKEIVEAYVSGVSVFGQYDVVGGIYPIGDFLVPLTQALAWSSTGSGEIDVWSVAFIAPDSIGSIVGYYYSTLTPNESWERDFPVKETITTTNKTVPTSGWSSNSTYADLGFNYRAAVSVSSVTTKYIPDVNFSPADQYSGNLAAFADTYNGGVYIYAKTQPTETVTIASAIFTRR